MTDIRQRLFISYAGPDRTWAEWVDQQLMQAGYQTELDKWDWRTGDDFVQKMNQALGQADAVVALFSKNYFAADRWTRVEWAAAVAGKGQLIPLEIEPLTDQEIPTILSGKLRKELHGLDKSAATTALLEAIHGAVRPTGQAPFPGDTEAPSDAEPDDYGPRLPSSVGIPEVWNVRRRNLDFSGREAELGQLRARLLSGRQAVVQALHGMGGIGKTQIALEYAHRFASQYDLVWWIDAEQANQLPVHYTELAKRLGIAKPEAGSEPNARALLQHLRTQHRWLLVLDNAEHPDQLEPWLPEGPGHILITSRNPDWRGIAHTADLDVFNRTDSLEYLKNSVPGITTEHAGLLAQDLGDLPLALAQVVGILRSGMTIDRYRQLLATSTARLLEESDVRDYPASLAATVDIAVNRLRDDGHLDAAALLSLGAFLGPEPIPITWLETARAELVTITTDPDDLMWPRSALQPLSRYGLARIDLETFQIHRLTQGILRTQIGYEQVAAIRRDVAAALAAVTPGDAESPSDWPTWSSFAAHVTTPHVLAAINDRAELRPTLLDATLFLLRTGQARGAYDFVTALQQAWSAELGPDHPDALTSAQYLGHATAELGDLNGARVIIEDALARRRRVLGDDHPDTLQSGNDTSAILFRLGRYVESHRMDVDVLARRRRVLGENHPDTLQSSNSLAVSEHELGFYAEARRMKEDVLARRRQILGDDHPDTLASANSLASSEHALGFYTRARRIKEDVLARRRQILGDDHPDTLSTAIGLAATLRALNEHGESRSMVEDVLARRRRILGENHPDTLEAAHSLAIILDDLTEYGGSRSMVEDVLVRRRRILGDDHPDTLETTHSLAAILHDLKEYAEARRMKEDVLARRRHILGVNHPNTLESANSLAVTLHEMRHHTLAIELLRPVLTQRRQILGEKHPDTLRTARNLAATLTAVGRVYEAQQLASQKPRKRRFGRKRR
ncbi:FxSxx-COOH system tetratricopeptide repeat protein [Streptomyces sioyaensis]|uniref:FxSxx-COOH system tetratricopeptide repeat protein n=1 Tax=Streptomyces sioyaensis TaxID=67364 RepID=UPI0037A95438